MFIRKARKTDQATGTKCVCYQLVESYRTPNGPKQRILLDLGRLDLDKQQLKILAKRIDEILKGERRLFGVSQKIESLARHFASMLRKQRLHSGNVESSEPEGSWENVNLDMIAVQNVRTVGAEVVGAWAFDTLGMAKILQDAGLGERDIALVKLLILGKLIHPGSEIEIYEWFSMSQIALEEIIGIDARDVSLTSLYRACDSLIDHKEFIEEALTQKERTLFGLGENLILFDLTNTYFEGTPVSSKAKHGASKEKRTDSPLVTLALIIDEDGFAKWSKVFAGNISEPATLKTVLGEMLHHFNQKMSIMGKRVMVVFDAGVATEVHLNMVREMGLDYVCIDRRRIKDIPQGDEQLVHECPSGIVRTIRDESSGEVFLYCTSGRGQDEEEAIKNKLQKDFEQALQRIAEGLKKKGGIKRYEKILERIGRLKEKYGPIAYFYEINVTEKNGIAQDISWSIKNELSFDVKFAGFYRLRSSRMDLSDKELWDLYNMLTNVEDSFQSLKDEFAFESVYYQVYQEIEGHVFLTVLAYHLLWVIQKTLHEKGIRHNWKTLRESLSGQFIITTTMVNDKGQVINIRHTSEPEPMHVTIYQALGLSLKPLKTVRKIE